MCNLIAVPSYFELIYIIVYKYLLVIHDFCILCHSYLSEFFSLAVDFSKYNCYLFSGVLPLKNRQALNFSWMETHVFLLELFSQQTQRRHSFILFPRDPFIRHNLIWQGLPNYSLTIHLFIL